MQKFQDDSDTMVAQPGDERLFVKFYDGTKQDKLASEREGRPIYTTVPFIRILIPGDRNTIIDTYADENYKRRFPKQWAAYQAKESQAITGTLLSEVPVVSRAQCEELEYFKVFTVEQLAGVSDNLASKIPSLQELKRKAQTYVDQAKDAALAQKLNEENAGLKNRISALESELARLSQMFDAAMKPQTEAKSGVERSGNRR
jgi:uncharacterized protein YdaL